MFSEIPLSFLDSSANRSLKTESYNSRNKTNAFLNSSNFVTKSLVSNSDSQTGPANKKAIDMLSHFEKFEEKDIFKRQEEIVNLIATFFEIS